MGMNVALRDAIPACIEAAKILLRIGIPLLGSESEPFRRLLKIKRDALAPKIKESQFLLGVGVVLLGGETQPSEGPDAAQWHTLPVDMQSPSRGPRALQIPTSSSSGARLSGSRIPSGS
jgi:hypothetical protein